MSGASDKTITGDVLVPLAQAAISGLLAALAITAIWSTWGNLTAWRLFTSAFSVGGLLAWLAILGRWLAWVDSERGINRVAPARVYQNMTRIQVTASDPSGAYAAGVWADFDLDLDRLIRMARRVNSGVSFSHAGLAGPHRPLSRSEFEALRDEFISRGLAYWKNAEAHGQGVCLTRAGEAVIRHLARMSSTLPERRELLPGGDILPTGLHAHTRTHATRGEVIQAI